MCQNPLPFTCLLGLSRAILSSQGAKLHFPCPSLPTSRLELCTVASNVRPEVRLRHLLLPPTAHAHSFSSLFSPRLLLPAALSIAVPHAPGTLSSSTTIPAPSSPYSNIKTGDPPPPPTKTPSTHVHLAELPPTSLPQHTPKAEQVRYCIPQSSSSSLTSMSSFARQLTHQNLWSMPIESKYLHWLPRKPRRGPRPPRPCLLQATGRAKAGGTRRTSASRSLPSQAGRGPGAQPDHGPWTTNSRLTRTRAGSGRR